MRFKGQVVGITGAAQGIGLAIAERLSVEGAHVGIFDRQLERVAQEAQRLGCSGFGVDVCDEQALAASIAALHDAHGRLDGWVNCAGISLRKAALELSAAEWRRVIDVNLTGSFHVIRAASAPMVQAGGGRIVNVVSINGLRGKVGQGNYAAAKAGLIALTKTIAKELGPKGVTCNAVAPGMVLTEMTLALDPQFRDKALAEAALKDLPDTADIANAVLFLLSDAARRITGEVIKVDSGQYI